MLTKRPTCSLFGRRRAAEAHRVRAPLGWLLGTAVVGLALAGCGGSGDAGAGSVPLPLAITTTTLPDGIVGAAYSQTISATGGGGGYTWSVVAGALPVGLSLSPSGTPSATLSGAATTGGTSNFTVQALAQGGNAATQALSLSFTPATFVIDNPSVDEGSAGPTTVRFTVTLSTALALVATVDYATADGTAVAPLDYTATAGTLVFPAGYTARTIDVPVGGDTTREPDETFTITLTNPTIATIATPTGTATLQNDDASGDFNGDGFPDVIIGSARATTKFGASQAGAAYLFFGSAIPAATITPSPGYADVIFTGADPLLGFTNARRFGQSVVLADVNGDGFADAVVGAALSEFAGAGSRTGGVYVFFGGPAKTGTFSTTDADVIIAGVTIDDLLGASVTVGDLNGDGIGDILAGAPGVLTSSSGSKAFVYFGSTTFAGTITTPDAVLATPPKSSLGFGAALAAGDVNGDGFDDALIGESVGEAAYLFYGSAALSGTVTAADVTLTAAITHFTPSFGAAVALGDTNGDGYAELLVGAKSQGVGGGETFLFLGSPTLAGAFTDTAADTTFVVNDPSLQDAFGHRVAIADHNGDGFGDVIVTAPRFVTGFTVSGPGTCSVFFGGTTPFPVTVLKADADRTVVGDPAENLGGTFGVGDLNGDGYVDVFAGTLLTSLNWIRYVPGMANPPSSQSAASATAVRFHVTAGVQLSFGSGIGSGQR